MTKLLLAAALAAGATHQATVPDPVIEEMNREPAAPAPPRNGILGVGSPGRRPAREIYRGPPSGTVLEFSSATIRQSR